MSDSTLTPEQRAEVEQLIHDAIAPVAAQTTRWIQRERARLTDPRRTWTGRPIGATPPGRTDPTPSKPPPPVAPEVHTFDGTHRARG